MNVKESWSRVWIFVLVVGVAFFLVNFLTGSFPMGLVAAICVTIGYVHGAFSMMHSYKRQIQNAIADLKR